jgi:hypothetical protein
MKICVRSLEVRSSMRSRYAEGKSAQEAHEADGLAKLRPQDGLRRQPHSADMSSSAQTRRRGRGAYGMLDQRPQRGPQRPRSSTNYMQQNDVYFQFRIAKSLPQTVEGLVAGSLSPSSRRPPPPRSILAWMPRHHRDAPKQMRIRGLYRAIRRRVLTMNLRFALFAAVVIAATALLFGGGFGARRRSPPVSTQSLASAVVGAAEFAVETGHLRVYGPLVRHGA